MTMNLFRTSTSILWKREPTRTLSEQDLSFQTLCVGIKNYADFNTSVKEACGTLKKAGRKRVFQFNVKCYGFFTAEIVAIGHHASELWLKNRILLHILLIWQRAHLGFIRTFKRLFKSEFSTSLLPFLLHLQEQNGSL